METLQAFLPTVSSVVVLGIYIYVWGRNAVTKDDLKGITKQIEELEKKIEDKYLTKEVHRLSQENIDLKITCIKKITTWVEK